MDVQALAHESLTVGAVPLINHYIDRLGLASFLEDAVGSDPRAELSSSLVALVLVRNFALCRHPLYSVPEWLARFVPELQGLSPQQVHLFNDDRIGRFLDRLFRADRHSLLTRIIVRAVRDFNIRLDQLHNDSTSLTFAGDYSVPGHKVPGKPPVRITHGFNKDHRPDLKQLVLSLSLSADGFVPVHYRLLDGNTSDDVTHIQTWNALRELRGGDPDFLYVADSKLCTRENLAHICAHRGRFITVLPRTRTEDTHFRDRIQHGDLSLSQVWRGDDTTVPDDESDIYWVVDSPFYSAEGYRIVWFRSSTKYRRDQLLRQKSIDKALRELNILIGKVGTRSLKTRAQIEEKIAAVLDKTGAARWISPVLTQTTIDSFKQTRPGRPGKDTDFKKVSVPAFQLSWVFNKDNLLYDAATDGFFPLITNLQDTLPVDLLRIYKQQPRLEKRHEQLKTVLEVAPVNIKTPERIEAFVFLYFLALLLGSLLERHTRLAMKHAAIDAIPIYPEQRLCRQPTAEKICELFEPLRRHRLLHHDSPVAVFHDPLTDIHRQVLTLLNLPLDPYCA